MNNNSIKFFYIFIFSSIAPATEQPRTSNPLFRRRQTFTTTTTPPVITTITTKKEFLTTISPSSNIDSTDLSILDDDIDQEAKSSIHQDHKFTNHRYNQIGELLEDELVDAIKAISKAPIPKSTSQNLKRTTSSPKNDFLDENQTTDPQPVTTRRTGTFHTTNNKNSSKKFLQFTK